MDARGRIRLYHRGNGADNLGHMGYEKEEMKKYELTSETKIFFGHILYRIKALSSCSHSSVFSFSVLIRIFAMSIANI